MMFARGIGDDNPIYSDLEYAKDSDVGHVIAPPTFAQASAQFDPNYSLRPRVGRPWGESGANTLEVANEGPPTRSGTGLHAEQHFRYFRHVAAGEVLFATSRSGGTWQREGRRGGTLSFSETFVDYRDEDGEIVITSRSVGVKTSKPVESE
jgi:hypothetical protein